MVEKKDFKHCPLCGNSNLDISLRGADRDNNCMCNNCGVMIRCCDTPIELLTKWNLRRKPIQTESGMYAITTNPEGNLKVGSLTLCKQSEGRIWIQDESGTGGDFPLNKIEIILKEYFYNAL
jgi:hypothetical protein